MRLNKILSVSFVIVLCMLTASCVTNIAPVDIWENAIYTEDVTLGTGEININIEVVTPQKTVLIKVNTDKILLGDALNEHELIKGEQGPYGLYVKSVNGIFADYNSTKTYWSINKNGEYMQTGVDTTELENGETYQFVYTDAE